MTQYLLVAEADQIQDFIFSVSRLREVVGGSQLLTRFCEKMPDLLLGQNQQAEIIVNGGGKFKVLFADEPSARVFGQQLAEAYRRVAGGSLSVADPVAVGDDFRAANEAAEKKLRQAKRNRRPATMTTPHLPQLALCASSGMALAVTHDKLEESDPRPNYLSRASQVKRAERETNIQRPDDDYFLRPFAEAILGDKAPADWTTRPEDVSDYDPRRYVAYLVADGNDMGQVFKGLDQAKTKKLSREMRIVLRTCLSEVTKKLKGQSQIEGYAIPVLPLILGGDDLFALLPAPWALSFAFEFCQAYQERVGELLVGLEITDFTPTIAAAVVICKQSYPHTLAHQVGAARLKRAKQVGKLLDTPLSTVDFEVIMGTQAEITDSEALVRPTLRPYLVPPLNHTLPIEAGLPVKNLLTHRYTLGQLPKRRLALLRQQFAHIPESKVARDAWAQQLDKLVKRSGRNDQTVLSQLQQALKDLGTTETDAVYWIRRKGEADGWQGHGLPDLLQVWDFAFDLHRDKLEYYND